MGSSCFSSSAPSAAAQVSSIPQKVDNLKHPTCPTAHKVYGLMEHLGWPSPANQLLHSSQQAGGCPVQCQSYCSTLTTQVAPPNSNQTVRDILQGFFLVPEQSPSPSITGFPAALRTLQDLAPAPKHQASIRVAYQGVPGAYSEAAVMRAYPSAEAAPCQQFEGAFQAVESWVTDRAVLPLENSLGGSIHRNYDLLLRHRLHIVGEVQLPVHHCLLALPGVQKEDLRRVISHPQALAQCEHTLSKIGLTHVSREAVDDTAGAAEFIAANGLRDTAAIASCRAAEIYGMNVLANGIQDDAANVTRFVTLARDPVIPRNDMPFKTSLAFSLEEGPGALFKVLGALYSRNINVTKIESRPQRGRPVRIVDDSHAGTAKYFQYLFYLDMEASMADPKAQKAVRNMQEYCTFLRVLGSYPMDMTPL